MNTISFETSIDKVTTMKDHGLKIVLGTQELPDNVMAQLFTLSAKHCACVLAPHGEEIKPFDPVTTDAPKSKSPANRLRSVLYLIWKKDNEGYADFDQYYKITMEKIITYYKEKIDG